jgi:hypothetical protein
LATIFRLDPPIPVQTPKGSGIAHLVIDYGIEEHLYWVVFLDISGQCWTFGNPEIRACMNITLGRVSVDSVNPQNVSTKAD